MAAPRFKPHDPTEYIVLLKWFRGAKSILEIGSRFGYPLVDFAHCMEGRGVVISVDLPDAEGWNDKLSSQAIVHLRSNIQQLYNEGYDSHLFEGDSKDPAIIDRVRSYGPFDVVFIDGDHSYEGCKRDLVVAYSKVKPNGYILGHDYELNMKKAQTAWEFGVRQAVDEFCVQTGQTIKAKGLDGCVSYAIQVCK
jgi:predicted O-methyltransferase YrrM